ncbi:uncharacterized protein STEHIDRAFT_129868 [Stereum hirsutum FP-91666 SS1]|uniref:uncharacterized protein n=1 Tax=Stereum hirsutum (strain FP-91666) TaxID=721885 RepID=UPI000440E98D|nr:uncharacterized protein STEHIDRAFT_129868 [Stereum hirsutum FP-91666 SS1]EIM87818.1 hypothetical protein STEHIDRAFT_129868 [Stereum hirsutum FP-91666 SS1]
MLALENGRARELRHRFLSTDILNDSEDSLEDLPEPLKTAYLSALDTLKRSPLMDSGADSSASRALHAVINLIREVPGCRNFMTGIKVSDVVPAIEDGWPLLYVDPTPFGTLLLLVRHGAGEGGGMPAAFRYSCRLLEETKSGEITLKCQVGHNAKISNYKNWEFIHNAAREATLPQSLEGLLRWLGNRVARHIHALVADATKDTGSPNTVGLTIVACGHISMMPIDAASWRSSNSSTTESQCLSDTFFVRYAPSAAIVASCARKARALDDSTTMPQSPPTFVAVGNPLNDLPQSRSEIKEIEAHFPSNARHTAFESNATIPFIATHAPAATYLHFATHAQANYLPTVRSNPESQACVQLSDGALLATHIPSWLSLTRNRLTVLSACETVVRGIDLPDEAFSIGSAILASGSACVVGSMWKVDDHATGLLMVRMYEEMLEKGRRPPEALREAKTWLRGLDMDGLADGIRENGYFDGKPFEHPFFWAGFVAVGI